MKKKFLLIIFKFLIIVFPNISLSLFETQTDYYLNAINNIINAIFYKKDEKIKNLLIKNFKLKFKDESFLKNFNLNELSTLINFLTKLTNNDLESKYPLFQENLYFFNEDILDKLLTLYMKKYLNQISKLPNEGYNYPRIDSNTDQFENSNIKDPYYSIINRGYNYPSVEEYYGEKNNFKNY